jgi:hypothetical protein
MRLDIFNACEAVLWMVVAIAVAVRYVRRGTASRTRRVAIVTAVFLVLFGVSDVIEMQTGAWWRPPGLLALKAFCLIGLVVCFSLLVRWK